MWSRRCEWQFYSMFRWTLDWRPKFGSKCFGLSKLQYCASCLKGRQSYLYRLTKHCIRRSVKVLKTNYMAVKRVTSYTSTAAGVVGVIILLCGIGNVVCGLLYFVKERTEHHSMFIRCGHGIWSGFSVSCSLV